MSYRLHCQRRAKLSVWCGLGTRLRLPAGTLTTAFQQCTLVPSLSPALTYLTFDPSEREAVVKYRIRVSAGERLGTRLALSPRPRYVDLALRLERRDNGVYKLSCHTCLYVDVGTTPHAFNSWATHLVIVGLYLHCSQSVVELCQSSKL